MDVFFDQLEPKAQHTIECLCKFIKRNKNLVHVDFSHTGLTEKQMWYFGRTMRRSYSLRSLHLSGNPGITRRLKDYLQARAHCSAPVIQNTIDMMQLPSLKEHHDAHRASKDQSSSKGRSLSLRLAPKQKHDFLDGAHAEAAEIKALKHHKAIE